MPEASRFVGNSIEELLVSLADGVREAQSALNSGPLLDPSGRPLATYQLPYLDFTVQVDMQTRADTGGRPIALLFMVKPSSTSTDQRVTSTISGRLVAVPPGDGLPVPRLALAVGERIESGVILKLTATNSAGERLAHQRVELNIDDADSEAVSAARGVARFVRSSATRLADAIVQTLDDGTAELRLLIGAADSGSRAVVVVVATIGSFSARAAVPLDMVPGAGDRP